jgi:hypothetical protein
MWLYVKCTHIYRKIIIIILANNKQVEVSLWLEIMRCANCWCIFEIFHNTSSTALTFTSSNLNLCDIKHSSHKHKVKHDTWIYIKLRQTKITHHRPHLSFMNWKVSVCIWTCPIWYEIILFGILNIHRYIRGKYYYYYHHHQTLM